MSLPMMTSLPQKLETLKSRSFHFGILKNRTSTTIPVEFKEKLENYELPVVGMYIHRYILPGFRYRVRLTGTNEYLFGGKALKLESIGQGYGKRITFESDDILENNNFFWSDSHDAGFAFTPELLLAGEVYQVMDSQGKSAGTFSVDTVNTQQQITGVTQEKDIVNIHARVTLRGNMRLLPQTTSMFEKDIPLLGEVIVKVNRFSRTLDFVKIENGGKTALDSALQFVKHLI